MAEITSPHIWYVSGYPGSAVDLRQVISWSPDPGNPSMVNVRFVGDTIAVVQFDRTAFEAAKQNSLDNGG